MSGIKIAAGKAITDASATSHLVTPDAPITDVVLSENPLTLHMLDGGTLKPTREGLLHIPWPPKEARKVHFIPGLCIHPSYHQGIM